MKNALLFNRFAALPTFRSLRHRNYRLFFFGQVLSLIGTWMQIMAQQWLVYQLTSSSAWLGTIGFLQNIPILLFSLYAGLLADRMSKHRLMIMMQIISIIPATVLGIAVLFNFVSIELIAVMAFMLGTINAFEIPIRQSFIVELVGRDDLVNAIALNSAMFNMARITGPAIGGFVIASLGLGWCFILNAFSFIAVIVGLLEMDIPKMPVTQARTGNTLTSFKESLRYVRKERTLVALFLLVIVVTIFGWSYSVLLPVFAEDILKIGAIGLGNLLTAVGIGAFFSAVSVASLEGKISPRTFVYSGIFLFVFSVSLFSLSAHVTLSVISLVGVGAGLVAFFSTANASVQRRVPDGLRGRVMGLYSLVFQGLTPFGSLLVGFMAEIIGVRMAIFSGGLLCGVCGIVVYSYMNSLRKKETTSA